MDVPVRRGPRRFRAERGVDAATWSRGRGWTLWKSLITMVGALEEDDDEAVAARRREIDVITADFAAEALDVPALSSDPRA